jgi:hypothetical protein
LNNGQIAPTPDPNISGPADDEPRGQTFRNDSNAQPGAPSSDLRLRPIPDAGTGSNKNTNTLAPQRPLGGDDRTTAVPTQRAWAYQPVAAKQPIESPAPSGDDDGWRPARVK